MYLNIGSRTGVLGTFPRNPNSHRTRLSDTRSAGAELTSQETEIGFWVGKEFEVKAEEATRILPGPV